MKGERHRAAAAARPPRPGRTSSPLIQHTVGAGSPLISTSSRSLFPATTVMTLLVLAPLVSRWILGGSLGGGKSEEVRAWKVGRFPASCRSCGAHGRKRQPDLQHAKPRQTGGAYTRLGASFLPCLGT